MIIKLRPQSFIFIRHGQTDWNRERRTMGQTDIPLNERGLQQAYDSVRYLIDLGVKRIVHSPLMRAFKTAAIINETLGLPMISQDDLKECCWGIKEGSLRPNAMTIEEWVMGYTVKGAEAYVDFRIRVVKAIAKAIDHNDLTLVVAHGGSFRALMDVLNYNHRRIDNCIPVAFDPPTSQNDAWHVHSLDPHYKIKP